MQDTERKLATIRKISAIEDIVFRNAEGQEETAENIVMAKVDGWQLVTQRSNGFKPGDKIVYFEIDSVLPSDNPEFAFLEKYKYRLRTIKLKGQISQGLILPISVALPGIIQKMRDGELEFNLEVAKDPKDSHIPEEYAETLEALDYTTPEGEAKLKEIIAATVFEALVGYDVTEMLGVTKYEAPIPANLAGKVKGSFPSFLHKTDEERIQNCGWLLEKYKNEAWQATEKLDGSSFTCYRKDGVFGVCSRNLDLIETPENTFWQVARSYRIEEQLVEKGIDNVAIQGEIVGPGINGNKYKLNEVKLYVFNFFDIENQTYIDVKPSRVDMIEIINMGLEWVPWPLDFGPEESELIPQTVEAILALADGPSEINPKVMREGLVFRPIDEIDDPKFGRVSFKAISNAYLLKNE